LLDKNPDPGGPKTYGSDGSGSATLVKSGYKSRVQYVLYLEVSLGHLRGVAVSALLLLHHKLVLTKNQVYEIFGRKKKHKTGMTINRKGRVDERNSRRFLF
jgi:hypothetical protein